MDEFEKRKQDLINNIDNMLRNENWGEPDELGWRENKSFPGMKRREEGYTVKIMNKNEKECK